MRVENYDAFAKGSLLSGSRKTGNVPSPNYNDFDFNTKKPLAMSDEKYREAIIEQAKKDQSAGKFQSDSAGFRSLVKSYVSAVSPDRKNIISRGFKAIFKNSNPQPKTLNLIDYLLGSVKYCKEAADVSYAEFYDSTGEMVASYSNGRWISYGTTAENARESELLGIYNEAWNNAAKSNQKNSFVADTHIGLIDQSV
ncbi:hypothetical protein A7X67_16945 [Clostridium sp. W14A]|uniref:Uncharacterized protein n=1 Tax=Caproicibacter fermentans TaxID=2576756 RepID=A0A7G8TB05_9FIRM|nr:hypothetical protein [Caproicibacter fermentans]OCN00530.1 hypothetical protein A7X67_16945 [Clostridium sp. W14A]QNK40796.1 hypothetical protein HCR03_00190 [Caproicibacter fermentans]